MDDISKISEEVKGFWENLGKAFTSAGFVVGMILIIIGVALLIQQFIISYKIHEINNWSVLPHTGTIIDSYMENSYGNITYSIFFISSTNYELRYRTRTSFHYEINGKRYVSDRLSYFEPWGNNPIIARVEFDRYQPNTKVDIIVNPHNPAEAYILNKPYTNYYILGLGILLSVIGLYIFYST